jgi:hypothetical protein
MEAGLDSLGELLPHPVSSWLAAACLLGWLILRAANWCSADNTCACVLHLLVAGAVELRNTLNSKFGVDLPPTVTLDYPTIAALAAYLAANATSALAAGAANEAAGDAASVTGSDYSWSDGYSDSLGSSLALAELPPAPLVAVAAVSGTLPGSGCITSVAEDAPSGVLRCQSLLSAVSAPWLDL